MKITIGTRMSENISILKRYPVPARLQQGVLASWGLLNNSILKRFVHAQKPEIDTAFTTSSLSNSLQE